MSFVKLEDESAYPETPFDEVDSISIIPTKSRISFKDWINQPKTLISICYCLAFGALGLAIAAPGPSLLALKQKTNSDLAEMGYTFTGRSVGYLLGSILGGPAFDRFNGNKLLSMGLFYTGLVLFAIPWIPYLGLLAFVMAISGVAMGFLDTGGNVSIIWLHGEAVGPYMQSLHFSFGLGAFISPMVIGGVMDKFNGDPTWAFIAFGVYCLPISLWLWMSPPAPKQASAQTGPIGRAEKLVVAFTSLFLLVYVGAEVSAGGYLYSYAVLRKLAGETESAFLTSGFWGALTLGRLAAVPASMYMTPQKILFTNLVGCILGTAIWLLFSNSKAVLWIGCIIYGLGMSSSFPTAINMCETYLPLTGRLASILVVGAAVGEMIIPALVSNMFEDQGPLSFLITLFVCSLLGTTIFGIIIFIGKRTKRRLEGKMDLIEVKGEKISLEELPREEQQAVINSLNLTQTS